MSFKQDSIRNMVEKIEEGRVFLPAIQRRFVWKKEKIENLFDSIIKDYPIGTFLFWELKREKADEYVFYEFLREYDQRDPYNKRKDGSFLKEEIIGVLDGQQRLSSMYLGLQGTHIEKLKYHKKNNNNAYPKTTLHINLLSLPYEEILDTSYIDINTDKNFEFSFITKEVSQNKKNTSDKFVLWFKVGEVLKWGDDPDIDNEYESIIDAVEDEEHKKEIKTQKRYIKKFFRDFHKRVYLDEQINYFPIKKDDLEYVLEIFIRVNSGATILSKTDLMFSTIVATWEDGRDEIEAFIKQLNQKGEGFNFNNDFLMRSCLVLLDFPVLFKVNSFKSDNVEQIKRNWTKIKESLSKTVETLVEFGFNGSRLTSNNAIIIIAYYFMKGGKQDKKSKKNIQKYLLHALLKNIYGGQGDQVIASLRNELRKEKESLKTEYELDVKYKIFPEDYLSNVKLSSNKSLKIGKEDIEEFLLFKKGPSAFIVLSLLYPNIKFTEVNFHQDHIHPDSAFTKSNIIEIGINDELKIKDWIGKKDTLPNLQLMEGIQNITKNATPFDKWFDKYVEDKIKFCADNYIPKPNKVSYEFSNFENFYKKRKELLRKKLYKVLELN